MGKMLRWSHCAGFTLIEIAVVIAIIGILIAGLLATIQPIMQQSRLTASEANMNRVIDVISAYAQRNNRIPCPADPDQAGASEPFGAEIGSGAAGTGIGSCSSNVEGIIPFRTLGLDLDVIRDGWGNYITYKVSPAFARDPSTALEAHKRCRVDGLWVSAGANRAPEKARFCCPDLGENPSTDITVVDAAGDLMWPFQRDSDSGAPTYDNVDVAIAGAGFDPSDDNITQISFALISHGKNGFGSFLMDGSRNTTGSSGTGESENQDGDTSLVSAPFSFRDGTGYFDDIVMWRTQDQIYAETGAGSCSFP